VHSHHADVAPFVNLSVLSLLKLRASRFKCFPFNYFQMCDPINANAPLDPELRRDYDIIQNANRRTKEQTRRLFQNRPQSWRHLLRLLCAMHFTILFSRFVVDLFFWGPRATRLNVLSGAASAVALATRFTWHALFANPYSFFGCRRPGVQYRRAVTVVSVLTTVPAFILHVAMIRAAGYTHRTINIDYGQTILQMVLLLPAISLYVWMVRRFLLRKNDEHYEPTVQPYPLEGSTNLQGADAETVTVPDFMPSGLNSLARFQSQQSSPLSKVYAQQTIRRRSRNETGSDSETQTVESRISSEASSRGTTDPPESVSHPSDSDREQPHRCQTIAWFDYMPDSRLSDPLISFGLMIYGLAITWIVYLLIQENNLSKLPSSYVPSFRTYYLPSKF